MIEGYFEWISAQQEADRLRDRLFGLRVRNSVGREGLICRVNVKGLFVRYDGALMEERMRPDELEVIFP